MLFRSRRLKQDFPHLTIVVNGGVRDADAIAEHLAHVDGVMVGREAYHNPWLMADWDSRFWGAPTDPATDREAVEAAMVAYMARTGVPWGHVARHMLGLRNGLPGARRWRQIWSDHHLKALPPEAVWQRVRDEFGVR